MHSQELSEKLLTHMMELRYLGGDINLVRWSRSLKRGGVQCMHLCYTELTLKPSPRVMSFD